MTRSKENPRPLPPPLPPAGVVYKAVAEDEDLGLTCPLGPGLNTRCPCAAVHYVILESENKDNDIFEIHDSSGQMFLKKGALPRPGGQYQVEIVAASECRVFSLLVSGPR